MIRDEQLPELPRLRRAERRLPLRADGRFSDLVVATQNGEIPVHRWFRLKESFSPHLLKTVLQDIYSKVPQTLSILDPFAGVGTTLLSAQQLGNEGPTIQAVGIERNPFIAFAARTKVSCGQIDGSRLLQEGARAIALAEKLRPVFPSLSSIRTGRCMSIPTSRKILAIRDAIRQVAKGPQADALLLGLAAAIEPLSKTRKDGRALRIVDRRSPRILATIVNNWKQIAGDTSAGDVNHRSIALLLEGDGRDPCKVGVAAESIDLIFTSPPYPNNIDYNEVYKLEMWLLGFVKDATDFLSLRRQTFRSHPTSALPDLPSRFLRELEKGKLKTILKPILLRASEDTERLRVFKGYFGDMWVTLRNSLLCLRKGGHAVFVVGNSLHGNSEAAYLLPTDLIIATMAESLGFRVCDTIIARNLKRRLSSNHFLRESIVILRKPHD